MTQDLITALANRSPVQIERRVQSPCEGCGSDTDFVCPFCLTYARELHAVCGKPECREKHEKQECIRTGTGRWANSSGVERDSDLMAKSALEYRDGCIPVFPALEEVDEAAFQRAFHNSAQVPVEYPHARDATNVGKYFWRAALEYERNRKV